MPATEASPAPATAPIEVPFTQIPRNQTLIMSLSDTFNQFQDASLANSFLRAAQHTGWHFMFEPLFFGNPYWTPDVKWPVGLPGNEARIPWLAESVTYNATVHSLKRLVKYIATGGGLVGAKLMHDDFLTGDRQGAPGTVHQ
ncbi:MAG: hypothetical protein M3069_13545 [Chloroflexota bacterium]|nr:hypothetical protein [Chloroflexota bacterium]